MDDKQPNARSISAAQEQSIKILDYWHKIEFFESTDIRELEDNAPSVLRLEAEDLLDPLSLPWITPARISSVVNDFSPKKKYRYTVYFGIFDRSEIFQQAEKIYPHAGEHSAEQNQDQGRTCSIRVKLNPQGVIDPTSFEFSTVTWALGKLQENKLDGISMDAYEEATERLKTRFYEIIAAAEKLKQQHQLPLFLTTFEIIEFLKCMERWTIFSPQTPVPALYVSVAEDKSEDKKPDATFDAERISLQPLEALPSMLNQRQKITVGEGQKISPQDAEDEIAILNSFYIRDIERVMKDIKDSGLSERSALGRYLSGDCDKKEDLLTAAGKPQILEMLRLDKLPAGRWPSDKAHSMSLMQQFAINTLEETLAPRGLYSVNGPPGTGKTTMLRDVIANNIVKRAQVLATLSEAREAFSGELTLRGKTIHRLIPSLTGYEMVVVSSNNAAVENISQELPQTKSLGADWQDIAYLKPVAEKLAAKHAKPPQHNREKEIKSVITPLAPEEACWGLIASALGKYKNRSQFGQRIFYHSITQCLAPRPADGYRTLVPAINELSALSFEDAKSAFITARENLERILEELEKLQNLADREKECRLQENKAQNKNRRSLKLTARMAKWQERKPQWWSLNIRQKCRHQAISDGFSRRVNSAEAEYQVEHNAWQELQHKLLQVRQECAAVAKKYPQATFPAAAVDLEEPALQRHAFGQCPELNQARSQLTVKALELHQAWLANAHKELKLYDTLSAIPAAVNGKIADKEVAKAAWQLLFMIVPVVSSTFASVAVQFKNFAKEEFGWLFIDEAGQANPQQAVGALWRAKRAVAVGDPLQIEPVFTIPPNFVETIAQAELGAVWKAWSPGAQSVQTLADRVNPYGTRQIAKGIWLGSPLRVHRRCDDPMFTLANAIAYNNKMLHGRDNISDQDDFVWGASCWFDIQGEREGKHFIPAQARHVLQMIEAYYEQHQKLPDAYIITPFKEIKKSLKSFLKNRMKNVSGHDKWLKERIGTVHTFQGKEEKNVIFVLGLCAESPGAAGWASEKPNLLNVAVTRAQKRIYIIGSADIWGGCPYFETAFTLLPQRMACEYASRQYSLVNA
ncbi:DEAD/DEAH box helicase [Dryocola sp. BD626]|uniref:DEAD/DEAH box helicase n=1 Tax=Dryocola sp. BD626 TaxID=3133273 RepID=UPI003F4FBE39